MTWYFHMNMHLAEKTLKVKSVLNAHHKLHSTHQNYLHNHPRHCIGRTSTHTFHCHIDTITMQVCYYLNESADTQMTIFLIRKPVLSSL